MVNPKDYIRPIEKAKPGFEVSAIYEIKDGYLFFIRQKGVDDYMGGTTVPFLNKKNGHMTSITMYEIADEWKMRKLIYSVE